MEKKSRTQYTYCLEYCFLEAGELPITEPDPYPKNPNEIGRGERALKSGGDSALSDSERGTIDHKWLQYKAPPTKLINKVRSKS